MANKYWSAFSDRKITAPKPTPDSRGGSNPPYPERTFAWTTDIGPTGPKRNTTGTPEVKAYAAQHLADDKWIQGAIKKPGSFTKAAKRAGKSVGEYAQEKKNAPGVLGKRARLAMTLKKIAGSQ